MNRIAELRKEKHLNQVGLAMELNISQYMVSAYENERHQPTADMLITLADFFKVSIDYLIGRSDIRYQAEDILKNNLTKKEIQLLNLFKELAKEKQEQAIGVLFALKNYNTEV
ncbi:MAG: helix-turn-helix transcriptional regulator [Clostridia bacterium]|nr:helix-turn-helix transcriptional regulator [Clostridia bacterium]